MIVSDKRTNIEHLMIVTEFSASMKMWILYRYIEPAYHNDYAETIIVGCWTSKEELQDYLSNLIDTNDYEILEVEDGVPAKQYARIYIVEAFFKAQNHVKFE